MNRFVDFLEILAGLILPIAVSSLAILTFFWKTAPLFLGILLVVFAFMQIISLVLLFFVFFPIRDKQGEEDL